MNHCPWEKIDAFQRLSEFQRFECWIAEQLASGTAEEIPVKHRYAGATTFNERWFKHKPSGTVWRLVNPDPPFAGTFEPVEDL